MTIEAFVYPNGPVGHGWIAGRWQLSPGEARSYSLNVNAGDPNEGHLVLFLSSDGGPSDTVVTSPSPLPVNTWSHVAGTFAPGGTARLWINGTVVASGGVSGSSIYTGAAQFQVCRVNVASSTQFEGLIDGIRVSAEELTSFPHAFDVPNVTVTVGPVMPWP
jgi:hypothetical protein